MAERGSFALVKPERLGRMLSKMLDENEFFSPYGIRSISQFHERHPYVCHAGGQEYRVDYLPAESNTGMFGGSFKIECPTGSGNMMNLFEVAKDISDRLTRIFLRDERGRRAVYGGAALARPHPVLRVLPRG